MELHKIESVLRAIEADGSLYEEHNLGARAEALDHISFVQEIVRLRGRHGALAAYEERTSRLQRRLETVNERLFQRLRDDIASGAYPPARLRVEFDRYTDYVPCGTSRIHAGYDALDVLVDGLLGLESAPEALAERSAEMVHLEPTPARAILELVDRVPLTRDDVFYDLGSGLGQVVILVNLLTGVEARGVEVEPAYWQFAQDCADRLALANVTYLNIDARQADYTEGTVFYLFTPFTGRMLEQVLGRLQDLALRSPIVLCTYGPCTLRVAREPWLSNVDGNADHDFKLAVFHSTQ
jgi:hypothetical protein